MQSYASAAIVKINIANGAKFISVKKIEVDKHV